MLLLRAGAAAFVIAICCALLGWTELALLYADPYTAERDISTNVGIDQLTFFGISLNKLVFDVQGYTNTSLPTIEYFLNMKYGLFMLDLYWNHFTQKWQLCPGPIPANETADLAQNVEVFWNNNTYTCLPGFTVTDVFHCVESYLASTNVLLDADVVQFALNLKSIYLEEKVVYLNGTQSSRNATKTVVDTTPDAYKAYGQDYLSLGNSTLKDSLGAVESYMFTPTDLLLIQLTESVQYPTQYTYLFSLYKRVFPFVLSNAIHNSSTGYNVSSEDQNTIFFPSVDFAPWVALHGHSSLAQNISRTLNGSNSAIFEDWKLNTHFRMVIDNDDSPLTNKTASMYLQSGFSVILNSSNAGYDSEQDILDMANAYTPAAFWSWAPGLFHEDLLYNSTASYAKHYEENEDWYAEGSQTAYLCVSVTKNGWALQNCYDKIRGACQNTLDPFSWVLTEDIGSYVDWTTQSGCPEGFSVSIPLLSLEQFSLLSHLVSHNVLYPVWVDMNDITVPGCYVSGGPYALCPYQEAITTRTFVKSLAPSSLVALFLIILIFCERIFLKTPIHTNRKRHWKRKIADYYKENDYEGVPL